MLPTYLQNKNISSLRWLVLLVLLLIAWPIYAANGDIPPLADVANVSEAVSAQTMMENIAKQIPNLTRMLTAIAYVMGMYFIFWGIVKLKQYGESRTMMSSSHDLKGPMMYIFVGALLLYLPTSVQVGMSTFWTNPTPYQYLQEQDQWSQFFTTIFMIIQFIGALAFIRGLVILSHLGGHGGQPGTLGKGLTHIIGGIFCINIYQFVQVILNTLGVPSY